MSLMKLSQTSEPETQEELEDQIAYSRTLLSSVSSKEATPINEWYLVLAARPQSFVCMEIWRQGFSKFGDKNPASSIYFCIVRCSQLPGNMWS